MLIYRASTLPNLEGLYAVMVELYGNGRHVHFLVCGPPNLALTRRYHRNPSGDECLISHILHHTTIRSCMDNICRHCHYICLCVPFPSPIHSPKHDAVKNSRPRDGTCLINTDKD